jgi:hypothetical protein
LTTQLVAPGVAWHGNVTDQFPIPVDPKYTTGEAGASYVTGKWLNQSHLTLDSTEPAKEFTVYAVLWPERTSSTAAELRSALKDDALRVNRPDGKVDVIVLTDASLEVK